MNDTRDDSGEFRLERQGRAGDSNRDKGSDEDSAVKSAPTDKPSSATVQDNAFPDRIRRKYYVVANESGKDTSDGEARLYADERGEYLAFKITEDRLVTRLAAAEVIRDMVSVAQHRQWEALDVRGSVEFRREAWLEAGARGLEVRGYQPTDLDRQVLADRREAWNRAQPRTREMKVHPVFDRDERADGVDYDKGVSGRLIEFGHLNDAVLDMKHVSAESQLTNVDELEMKIDRSIKTAEQFSGDAGAVRAGATPKAEDSAARPLKVDTQDPEFQKALDNEVSLRDQLDTDHEILHETISALGKNSPEAIDAQKAFDKTQTALNAAVKRTEELRNSSGITVTEIKKPVLETALGQPDATLFKDKSQADYWAREIYKLKPGEYRSVERVTKKIKVVDTATGFAGLERRQVPRHRWRVTSENFRSADRQTTARDADLVVAQSQMVVIEQALKRVFPADERARHSIMEAAKERIAGHLERGYSFPRATVIEPIQDRDRPGSDKDNASQRQNGERARIHERER